MDFSKLVIKEMMTKNLRSRPLMKWLVMNMTAMKVGNWAYAFSLMVAGGHVWGHGALRHGRGGHVVHGALRHGRGGHVVHGALNGGFISAASSRHPPLPKHANMFNHKLERPKP